MPEAAMFARFEQGSTGRWLLTGVLLLGEAVTADRLRKVPVAALENSWNLTVDGGDFRAEVEALPPLKREPGMPPEEFSDLVAQHYTTWARYVAHPADAMAAEHGIKVPTVHTWIREARLRGFLPPARRGKGRGL
ncbi:MAG: hypothetical protein GEV10_06415 [Streptosporangiales bacterium]|nr:hypothetical protein [Streptosporangiales bacterium]